MKRTYFCIGLLLSLVSHQVMAAGLYVQLFLDDAPLQGVVATLDDAPAGASDRRGTVSAELQAGQHVLILSDDDLDFPIEFRSAQNEDVEVSVIFTSAKGDEPEVSVRKFTAGEAGAEGYVTGTVTNTANSPIAGASVVVGGAGVAATTDANGVYVIDVPRGEYELKISHPEYRDTTVPGIRVLADLGVTAQVKLYAESTAETLQLPSTALEEVVVLGVFNPTEDAGTLERYATSITNAIDVAMLERFGDSDVAAALNRVVGVAVTDSKYATVRGLDGRYISSTLNGLLMPSTDPQRRDVQLDLFPTNILGGIEIQKSYTPDQLATTTGGSIKINTKGLPDERVFKVGASTAYNFDFTGDDILSYRGSNSDWLGFDSGLRDLPRNVVNGTNGGTSLTVCDPAIDPDRCTSPLEAAQYGVSFQDDYNVTEKTALPEGGLSVSYGDRFPTDSGEFGFYAAGDYGYSTSDRGSAALTNPLETTGSYMRSQQTVTLNGYVVAGYEYGAADEILSKTILLRNSEDTTRWESGVDREDSDVDKAILQWVERQFFSQEFTGHNEFDFDHGTHRLDWRLAYSRTDRDEPDRRQYTYFNGNLSTSAFERRWSELTEDSNDVTVDYTVPLDWGSANTTEFKAGILWSDKDREVAQYRFGIRRGDNADLDLGIDQNLETEVLPYYNYVLDKIRLAANTAATDSYNSQEEIQAYYLSANTDFGDAWSMLIGARFEDFTQSLEYPNEEGGTDNDLEYDDVYPALNLTYRPIEDIQLRAGYSETVSYPGLIERSESLSYDPDTDDPIFGNPDLRVSTIENYDLRMEYYFSEDESVSVAFFQKDIDQPVERALPDASGSAASGITFRNQDSAKLKGIEVDANMNLIDAADYLLFVQGNVSYIDSEVELSEDSIRLEGASANGRQLQGQSEWLGNIQLGFDHYPTEQKFTLLVNYFDDRIFRISRGENTGPEFEDGRILVDFAYEKLFGENLTLELQVKNLLNEDVEYSQNNRVIESYQTGTVFGASVTYDF
ncbi:TonB-dependent receptor [Parahaliea mediterranea]|uniref:TonB-dependent receptor n=1 Tax=Parahaliea mediterranea TaxID=651086 RepID=A0A939IL34_9GAMM|nr:TonB-dependent receptor [Parahaliea mediterranea]MBN7797971.1 TonB-dependent receptor [Parahaliea mediterranea]